jgi:hypothetical protein
VPRLRHNKTGVAASARTGLSVALYLGFAGLGASHHAGAVHVLDLGLGQRELAGSDDTNEIGEVVGMRRERFIRAVLLADRETRLFGKAVSEIERGDEPVIARLDCLGLGQGPEKRIALLMRDRRFDFPAGRQRSTSTER